MNNRPKKEETIETYFYQKKMFATTQNAEYIEI